ncbi:hypothetical protein BDP27DRAFT_1411827 [Rhodocollybia butyracea]|uniref:Uncharacterized protein n=1 Tax=Rhodocollybia butyracea TaxID=206335 RepID=A0A9P5P482_9AGAR|nr:hypothetical protein BDP27DRAFT_1411827 [Rhodocollybia butyracea]
MALGSWKLKFRNTGRERLPSSGLQKATLLVFATGAASCGATDLIRQVAVPQSMLLSSRTVKMALLKRLGLRVGIPCDDESKREARYSGILGNSVQRKQDLTSTANDLSEKWIYRWHTEDRSNIKRAWRGKLKSGSGLDLSRSSSSTSGLTDQKEIGDDSRD